MGIPARSRYASSRPCGGARRSYRLMEKSLAASNFGTHQSQNSSLFVRYPAKELRQITLGRYYEERMRDATEIGHEGRTVPEKRTLGCFLAAAICLFSALSVHAQRPDCSIASADATERSSFVPVMQGQYADPAIFQQLQSAYRDLHIYGHLPQASASLRSVLAASLAAKNRCGEGLASYGIGVLSDIVSFRDAEGWFQHAETAFTAAHSAVGLARTHDWLARIHASTGRDDTSAKEYERAAEELDAAGEHIAAIHARLGASDYGDPSTFARLQKRAQELNAPCAEADVIFFWGERDHQRADYQAAMTHYEAADLAQRAALQTSMGRLEREHGRAPMALPHYALALKLQRQSGDPSYIPQTLNAMATAYEAMGDRAHAIALLKEALAEAENMHSQQFVDFLSANLGSTYRRAGQLQLAIPLLETSAANAKSDFRICTSYGQLGDAYFEAGRNEEAIAKETEGLAACERNGDKVEISAQLKSRSKSEMRLGQMEAARSDSQRSLTMYEEYREHLVQKDAYKQAYVAQTRETYNNAIDVLMAMHHYGEALETAEQARSRAFLDLLSSGQIDGKPASPGKGAASYRDTLVESRHHTSALTSEQMMAEATRLHSTLLAYWLADTNLYIWVAQPGLPVTGFTQPMKPELLAQLVKSTQPAVSVDTNGTIATRGGGRITTAAAKNAAQWRKLYTLLIAPIQAQLPQEKDALLTIVPSGPLFQLSFAALMDGHGRYLVEHYRMHTIPTVGLLQFTERNGVAAAQKDPRYLLIADPEHLPNGANGKPLPKLPGTALEVNAIAHMLPTGEVKLLQGSQAREDRIASEIPRTTVLHFATHAVVDDAFPEKSFLALDNRQQDGRLTLGEVYGLNLHTHLVVLSACRTGLGKVTGDGVQGLSRAFFYAGSASVITTLWDVADQPTAAMLPRFYRALQSGQSPSDSLRTAQIAMLQDLRNGRIKVKTLQSDQALPPDPAYWAAFALSGEP
jgi:CHAT domain-containing protein